MCRVRLDCNIYLLFEKQAFNGLLKVIGIQKLLYFLYRRKLFRDRFESRQLEVEGKNRIVQIPLEGVTDDDCVCGHVSLLTT